MPRLCENCNEILNVKHSLVECEILGKYKAQMPQDLKISLTNAANFKTILEYLEETKLYNKRYLQKCNTYYIV